MHSPSCLAPSHPAQCTATTRIYSTSLAGHHLNLSSMQLLRKPRPPNVTCHSTPLPPGSCSAPPHTAHMAAASAVPCPRMSLVVRLAYGGAKVRMIRACLTSTQSLTEHTTWRFEHEPRAHRKRSQAWGVAGSPQPTTLRLVTYAHDVRRLRHFARRPSCRAPACANHTWPQARGRGSVGAGLPAHKMPAPQVTTPITHRIRSSLPCAGSLENQNQGPLGRR